MDLTNRKELKEFIKSELSKAIKAVNEERWITIKPHGDDSKGKHLLLKDGESIKDAMHRNGWYSEKTRETNNKNTKISVQENLVKTVDSINSFLKQGNFNPTYFNNERLKNLDKALKDISKKYKIEKLDSIKSDNTIDAYANANANVINIREDFCNADNEQLKSYYDAEITTYKNDLKNAIDNASLGIARGYNYYKKQLKTLKLMDKFERYGVHSSSSNKFFTETIVHELGHVISKRKILEEYNQKCTTGYFDLIENTYNQAIQTKDIYKISFVAFENFQEFFAEAFVQYYINEPMPQYIKDMIEKFI